MTGPLFLAIDQGSHASRASIFDAQGRPLHTAAASIATQRPRAGWVEHDAEAVAASVRTAVARVTEAAGPAGAAIEAAGLATQRSTVVCWDRRSGAALSPALSWQDVRAAAFVEDATARAPWIHERTGLFPSAHYGAGKLRWCLDHIAAVQRGRTEHRLACGPLASFLLFRLLDDMPLAADPGNAARMLLWNLGTRDWDDDLLRLFGLERPWLPPCVDSRFDFGHLTVGPRSVPLTVATGDQPAALFAAGHPSRENIYINMGTGAFAQRLCDSPKVVPGLLTGVVYTDDQTAEYVQEGTVNGAGAALDWAAAALGWGGEALYGALPGWLAEITSPPLFLNGVGGLGTPYLDPDFRSRFLGGGATPEKTVAVIESVVFLLAINIEQLAARGPAPRRLIASGGMAGLDGLCQRLADLSGLPVERPRQREATSRGLAWLVAGRPSTWAAVAARVFAPGSNRALAERYERWRNAMDTARAGRETASAEAVAKPAKPGD